MEKQNNYHHGGLKSKLINNLLVAVKNDALESFSIREFARSIGVSPAAPYNHFKDKEDLINSALFVSRKEFLNFLTAEDGKKDARTLILTGKRYLLYANDNPEFFNFIFSNKNSIQIGDNFYKEINNIFMIVIKNNFDIENFRSRVSLSTAVNAAWSMVHGVACLIANKSIDENEINSYITGKLFDELSAIWAVGISKPPKMR